MASTRLLLAALLFYSLSAFTQNQQPESSPSPSSIQLVPKVGTTEAVSLEPRRIIPNHELNPEWLQDTLGKHKNRYEDYETFQDNGVTFHFLPDSQMQAKVQLPGGQIAAEGLCYAIRSYLVARDEKDSDSTHPVKSSTCQKAVRYRLKNVQPPGSSDR